MAVAPVIGCGIERALPPPSPIRTALGASRATRPSRSPSRAAARKRVARLRRSIGSASKRGRSSSTRRRARERIWRQLSSLRSTIAAISSKPKSKDSRSTKTARSTGDKPLQQARASPRRPIPRIRRPRAPRPPPSGSGQPGAHVGLAAHAGRAQDVDRQPRRDRRHERPLVLDDTVDRRAADVGLLDDVLRLGDRAEHPVGDREEQFAHLSQPGMPSRRRTMHILIAGATGAAGRALIPYLTEHGHTVTGTTRGPQRDNLITMDGLDPQSVKRAIETSPARRDRQPDDRAEGPEDGQARQDVRRHQPAAGRGHEEPRRRGRRPPDHLPVLRRLAVRAPRRPGQDRGRPARPRPAEGRPRDPRGHQAHSNASPSRRTGSSCATAASTARPATRST